MQKRNLAVFVAIPRIHDEAVLTVADSNKSIPFPIRRAYTISHVKRSATRGKHAHHRTKQVIFCLQGKISITLDDGSRAQTIRLDKPEEGLLLDRMIWHTMNDFTPDIILLVFASEHFSEADYIRSYTQFKKLTRPSL